MRILIFLVMRKSLNFINLYHKRSVYLEKKEIFHNLKWLLV